MPDRTAWKIASAHGWWSGFGKNKKGKNGKKPDPPVHDDMCTVKDVFSNKIVGYSIGSRMKTRIAVNAPEMAVTHRSDPRCVVVHSDRGSQFRSGRFLKTLRKHKLHGSMGPDGAAGDNAFMESFFSLLQKNVLDRQVWDTRQQLRLAIMAWIKGRYHRKRRQRTLGKITPLEFETMMDPAALAA